MMEEARAIYVGDFDILSYLIYHKMNSTSERKTSNNENRLRALMAKSIGIFTAAEPERRRGWMQKGQWKFG